jgi:hypothetical protein
VAVRAEEAVTDDLRDLQPGETIWVRVTRTDPSGTRPEWVEDTVKTREGLDDHPPEIQTDGWDFVPLSEVRRRGPSRKLLEQCKACLAQELGTITLRPSGPSESRRLLRELVASFDPPPPPEPRDG